MDEWRLLRAGARLTQRTASCPCSLLAAWPILLFLAETKPRAKLVVKRAPGSSVFLRTAGAGKGKAEGTALVASPHTLRSESSSKARILHEPEKGRGAACSKPGELRTAVRMSGVNHRRPMVSGLSWWEEFEGRL